MANPTVLELAKKAKEKGIPLSFEKGQVLYYEGHHPFGGFLIDKGRVGLKFHVKEGRDKSAGSPLEGEFIGLEEILQDKPYASTAMCLVKTRVYFLSRPQIESWFHQ